MTPEPDLPDDTAIVDPTLEDDVRFEQDPGEDVDAELLADGPSARIEDFAHKLNMCIHYRNPPDGVKWSLRQIADGVVKFGGPRPSISTLSKMTNGELNDPKVTLVQALILLFDVEPEYFMTKDRGRVEDLDSQYVLMNAVKDAGLVDLALRLGEYTPEGRLAVAAILNGLDAVPGMKKPPPVRAKRAASRPKSDEQ